MMRDGGRSRHRMKSAARALTTEIYQVSNCAHQNDIIDAAAKCARVRRARILAHQRRCRAMAAITADDDIITLLLPLERRFVT